MDEDTPAPGSAVVWLQIEAQVHVGIQAINVSPIADQEITRLVSDQFLRQSFEGDFRANAGHITECDCKKAGHEDVLRPPSAVLIRRTGGAWCVVSGTFVGAFVESFVAFSPFTETFARTPSL